MSSDVCKECCDLCDSWFHVTCLKISDDQYKKINQLKDLVHWFCENDKLKLLAWKQHEIKKTDIEQKIYRIEKEVMALKTSVSSKSQPTYATVLKNVSQVSVPQKPVIAVVFWYTQKINLNLVFQQNKKLKKQSNSVF